jgi:hypothetical protein
MEEKTTDETRNNVKSSRGNSFFALVELVSNETPKTLFYVDFFAFSAFSLFIRGYCRIFFM